MKALQIQLWRQASPTHKMHMLAQLNSSVRTLAWTGLRTQYPQASEAELNRRLADLLLGEELAGLVPSFRYGMLRKNLSGLREKEHILKRYLVKPGMKAKLSDWDPNDTSEFKGNKEQGRMEIEKMNKRLAELQELLFAEHKHKVLIVLQAMDTGGKDGTIRHVFEGVNPNGVMVANFKEPSPEELDHDYLWRVHKKVPAKGELVIFNRSQYEDVLIVRVHEMVPSEVWKKRFDQINAFEQMLAENDTTILKFYLHIDKDEQKRRLQARLDDPNKHWKFRLGDLQERKLWPDYMKAYEDVLNKTSTAYAPWYIVPANHKWYRDLVISSVLIETLEGLKMKFPEPEVDLDGIVIE